MARKRMIDPSMWINEDFGTLSTLAELVFIGLFSNADDEGRGKASPAYIKAVLFPYKDDLRIADIEKTLQEVSSKMSVIFYSCDGNMYYTLTSWNTFQKIDRPTESKIPAYDETNPNIRLLFAEGSSNIQQLFVDSSQSDSGGVPPNRIEENKNKIKNKKKKEKEDSEKFIDENNHLIDEKFEDDTLKTALRDFIKMRKAIKKPLTERALELIIKELYKLSQNVDEQIKILEKSIVSNWQDIYPLNKSSTTIENRNYNNYDQREYDDLNRFYANSKFRRNKGNK